MAKKRDRLDRLEFLCIYYITLPPSLVDFVPCTSWCKGPLYEVATLSYCATCSAAPHSNLPNRIESLLNNGLSSHDVYAVLATRKKTMQNSSTANSSLQVEIRLTRFDGGKKGPVVMFPGVGVSSGIFSLDTIETNLVEFLVEHR